VKLRVLKELPIAEYASIQAPTNVASTQDRLNFFKFLRKTTHVDREPSVLSTKLPTHLEFDTATWLRFVEVPVSPVSLWITYKDEKGKSSILIDEQMVDDTKSLMLSGAATLHLKGKVEYVRVCCGGLKDEDRFGVDELFIKQVNNTESAINQPRLVG